MTGKKRNGYILSLMRLMAGVSICALLREPPAILQRMLYLAGLAETANNLLLRMETVSYPDWLLYGLPDLLWMISFPGYPDTLEF